MQRGQRYRQSLLHGAAGGVPVDDQEESRAGQDLGKDRGKCDAPDAKPQLSHQKHVQQRVKRGGAEEHQEGGTGVSAGAEKSREVVVQEGKQESCQNDVQIAHGFRGGLFRDSLGQQDGTAEEESCCGEEQRDPGAAEQRSGVGPAELFTVPGAEGAACQDADADASAEDQGI